MHCKIRPQHQNDDVRESDMQYLFSYFLLMRKYKKSLKLCKTDENIFKGIFLLCRFIKFLKENS